MNEIIWIGKTLMAYKSNGEASVCRVDGILRVWQTGNFIYAEIANLKTEYFEHEKAMLDSGMWA